MSFDIPQDCSWFPFSDEPLTTFLSSPCVVMPSDSCDKKWHLFANSFLGIHHYVSDSGTSWKHVQLVLFNGLDPYIYSEDKTYYLVYKTNKKKTGSLLKIRESKDLYSWSKASEIFDSSELNNQKLIMPQLFKVNGKYRLYFGISTNNLANSFACAESKTIFGPFNLLPDFSLGSGNYRFVNCQDFFYAFRCGMYENNWAITIYKSTDGISFESAKEKPILINANNGWLSGNILSCDVHYQEDDNCWYCYFCANNSLGLLLGNLPPEKQKVTESKKRGFFRKAFFLS